MRTKALAGALATLLCGGTAAVAQVGPGAPGTDQVIPEKKGAPIVPPAAPSSKDGQLSDKLSESNGVIKPPANVDPAMAKPAPVPNPNSTPVIKPPGTPGGPPGAAPK